jgi:mRNA interferase MazF
MAYRFGDIVLVPFPFTDQSTSKRRPAVVVSSELYSARHTDVILMAVTSQLKGSGSFGEVMVHPGLA